SHTKVVCKRRTAHKGLLNERKRCYHTVYVLFLYSSILNCKLRGFRKELKRALVRDFPLRCLRYSCNHDSILLEDLTCIFYTWNCACRCHFSLSPFYGFLTYHNGEDRKV